MANTVYGPYTSFAWVAGSTALSQTRMNALETQASVAIHGLNPDLAVEGFIFSGCQASGTVGTTTVNIASGIAYIIMTDGTIGKITVGTTTQTTVTINTTYNLYLQPDGTFYWSTSNSPQANSLYLATVATNGSGQIASITDKRQQLFRFIGAQSGLSLVLPNVTANLGGALAAPIVTGTSASAAAGAGMGTGAYKYVITYAFDGGETLQSAAVNVTTTGGNNQVSLTGIPVSADPRVTRRKIYRTAVGGSTYSWVATVGDNSTTTYTDAASDAKISSTVKVPPTRTTLGGNLRAGYPWGTSTPNTTNQGTVTGVTFNQTSMVTGDSTTAALFNGTSDKITFPVTGLPTGNGAWSLLAVVKPTNGTNTTEGVVAAFGVGNQPGQSAGIAQAAGGGWRAFTGLYEDIVKADAPTRYHRLNDNAANTSVADFSGNAQTGTASVNTSSLTATGLLTNDPDAGFLFVAASSHKITLPTGGSLPTGNGAFTLEAIVKIASNPAATAAIVTMGGTTAKTGGSLFLTTDGKLNCDLVGSSGLVTSPSGISTGVAHHCAAVWDGTTLTLYLDGVSVGTPTTPGANSIAASPPAFIGCSTSSTLFFNGNIDEAAIYPSALSAARILAHSNALAAQATTNVGTSVAGTKHLVAATYDGTTLTMNIDGGASTGTATPTARNLTLTNGRIGDNNNGTAEADFFAGTIQKVAIFNYALSSQQIALYNTLMGGASGNVTFDQQVGDDGALRYFTLGDATSSTTAAESSRYETSIGQDGQLKTSLPVSLDRGLITSDGVGGLTVTTLTTTNLAKPTQVAGQATAGSFGVPVIVAQALDQHITATGTQTILSFTPAANGVYRISGYFNWANGSNSNVTLKVQWTDPHAGFNPTAWFTRADTATVLNAMAYTAPGPAPTAALPITVYATTGGAITVSFIDSAGTPNDYVSAMIERLA